jgi:RES domain
MRVSKALAISPPTRRDLDAAAKAWKNGLTQHELAAGDLWWRVVRASSPDEALKFAETCYASPYPSRFTPIHVSSNIVPAGYAGSTRVIALWEVILREIRHDGIKRISKSQVTGLYLVKTRFTRPLSLLNLRRPHDANLVAPRKRPPKLTSVGKEDYSITRKWAQALYDRIPDIDGLIYESHQVPGDCIVLFQPKDPKVFTTEGDAQPVNTGAIRKLLRAEAKKAGAVIDFGDLPDPLT